MDTFGNPAENVAYRRGLLDGLPSRAEQDEVRLRCFSNLLGHEGDVDHVWVRVEATGRTLRIPLCEAHR